MKEIHAYLNKDGTYRVEALNTTIVASKFGPEKNEYKLEIPRAKVSVTGLAPSDEDEGKYFTIMIGDENTK